MQANADLRAQGRPYFTLSFPCYFPGFLKVRSPQLSAIKCKFHVSVYNLDISEVRLLRLGNAECNESLVQDSNRDSLEFSIGCNTLMVQAISSVILRLEFISVKVLSD